MTVELDVFSGQPNPTWPLPAAESAELVALLRALPGAPGPLPPDGLGYRGFILSNLPADLPGPVRVYQAMVQVAASPPRFYHDTLGLEQRLQQQAVQLGYASLLQTY